MGEGLSYRDIMKKLIDAGHQAYLVGGAVRDAYLGLPIKDYDVVTSATPKEILDLFDGSSIISAAFSVSVNVPSIEKGDFVEVVTMRQESDADYVDGKPVKFSFTSDLTEDLARRDMTINAIAMDHDGNIIDPFEGRNDIAKRRIRAIGDPVKRIKAHPIRMMRYVRFATSLDSMYTIEPDLIEAITKYRILIARESWDAIGKEFMKGLESPISMKYILTLKHLGLLEVILPEVYALNGVTQNVHHDFEDVWMHTLRCMAKADELGYKANNKLAVLLHDIGKPVVRQYKSREYGATFYQHEQAGADISEIITSRLRLPEDIRRLIWLSVRYHMYTVDSPAAARRFLSKIDLGGNNSTEELKRRMAFVFLTRFADVKKDLGVNGKDQSKELLKIENYALNLVNAEIDAKSVFRVTDLAVNGHDIMEALAIEEGKEVGEILNVLLHGVIEGKIENKSGVLLNEAINIKKTNIFTEREGAKLANGT